MTSQSYLTTALKAEHFVSRQQHETQTGVIWSLAKEKPDVYLHTFFAGSAGIALFYPPGN